jgi:subtilisin
MLKMNRLKTRREGQSRRRIAPLQLMLLILLSASVAGQIVSPKIIQAQLTNGLCESLPITGVTSSNNAESGNQANNVIDNNIDQRWAARGLGSFIQADLGSIKTICSLGIAWYKGDARHYNFDISVSKDGNAYTNVFSGTSSGQTSQMEINNFQDIDGRYVKVTVNGNSENEWASITEMKVDGLVKSPSSSSSANGQPSASSGSPSSPPPQISSSTNNTNTTNHMPFASNMSVQTAPRTGVEITLAGNDQDVGDALRFSVVNLPQNGAISHGNSPSSVLYVPNPGFTGSDGFTYKATDKHQVDSNIATVRLTVNSSMSKEPSSSSSSSSPTSISPKSPDRSNNESTIDTTRSIISEITSQKEKPEFIPNQYIAILKQNSSIDAQSLAQEKEKEGAEILDTYNNAIKGFVFRIPKDAAIQGNVNVLNTLQQDNRIQSIEQDQKVHIFSQILPTGVDRIDADDQRKNTSSNITSLNKTENVFIPTNENPGPTPQQPAPTGTQPSTPSDVNVDIAIVDTGIDLTHPDLNVYREKTFVPNTTSANDDNGHGTHVAGTAAARDNSIGVVGVAPGARLWAVKVLDSTGAGSISSIIAGIDYVTQHASEIDVVNLSFGCECHSQALETAINNSVVAGVTYVVAAGNSHKDALTFSPANNPNVIAVSAIVDTDGKCGGIGQSTKYGKDDTLASFSNYGRTVKMAAPGVNILSTFKGHSYSTLSGTSMAAPHVTGAAALYKASHPGATPSAILDALVNQGSNPSTVCDNNGHGYFANDPDGVNEPLLYVKNF